MLILVVSSLLTACTGGARTATSWPGITVDLERETVYVAFQTFVYALNSTNGTERWHYPEKADNKITFFAAPTLMENGNLVIGGYDSNLYSLSPENGALQWTFSDAENHYVGSAIAVGDKILAPNSDDSILQRKFKRRKVLGI